MKNKENYRAKNSQEKYRSTSYDQARKKSNFTSVIFESDSLCSPKQTKNQTDDKYKNYMQYVNSGNIIPQFMGRKTGYFIGKGKSVTPPPRKTSSSLIQHERKSKMAKEAPQIKCQKVVSYSKGRESKSPKMNKPLYVKGNNIIQVQTKQNKNNKIQNSRPVSAKKKKSKQSQKTQKTTLDIDKFEEEKQKKLLAQLFKGIQFYRDLGKGAHALVKSGVDWNNKRKIAIKIYEKKDLTNDELRSIQRQIQILGSLNHSNIIKLYEIIQSIKTINLVMQYGGGNSVEQYLKSKRKGYLQQNEAKKIFRQVIIGMIQLHDKNIAHRDIKTDNVLLNKYLKIKIIDFGFSIKMEENIYVDNYCGTPTYMAPEVVTKTPHNPLLADRWSLGIFLYTMLHGHCPFKAQTQKQLFIKICEGQYQFQNHVPLQAQDYIRSFLQINPQSRINLHDALDHNWLAQE